VTHAQLALALTFVFFFIYAVFASVDFGAGVLYLVARVSGKSAAVSDVIHRFQSPVWEVVNVFLIFTVVALIGFFPPAAFFFGTSMLVPASVALVLMVFRGSFIVFQHYFDGEPVWLPWIHGICGLFVPAALVAILPLSEGGFDDYKNGILQVHFLHLLLSPVFWGFFLLALSSIGYFSTMYMTFNAKKHNKQVAERFFRPIALLTGPPTFLFAVFTTFALRFDAPWHYRQLLHFWPILGLSALLFLLAGRLIYVRSYGRAFLAAVLQYVLAVGAYGWSHLPYLMYPYLTLSNGFTTEPMFRALFVSLCVGLVVLIPAIWLFYRMFLQKGEATIL
jgi:cytochrome bd ubiquinol oxidase subunit II